MATRKGTTFAVVLVLILIIIIVLVIVLRDTYSTIGSDFGTWTGFNTTLCLNEGQACTIEGTSQRYRDCNPNSNTGKGCIDSQGNQTYNREIFDIPCTPICFTSVWDTTILEPCRVFEDISGSIPKVPIACLIDDNCPGISTCNSGFCSVCVEPDEFRFEKIFRTCIVKDPTGTNDCVKNDGSLATVGESETVLIPCGDIIDCYPGFWRSCGTSCNSNPDCFGGQTCESNICQVQSVQSSTCSVLASDCGRLILTPADSACDIAGVPVDSSLCFPPDDPGPCETGCFNWPCSPFPLGFANISDYHNQFIEFFDSTSPTMFLVADFTSIFTGLGNNPLETTFGSNVIIITAPFHGFLENQVIGLQGVAGPTVNGIPIAEINGFHNIQNVDTNTFEIVVITLATSSGSDGGNSVDTILSQEEIVKAQNQDVFALGNIDIGFGTVALDRVRLKIIPSQAEVPNGAFYILAYLPYSGQEGIVEWDGAKLVIKERPGLAVGKTFDDVLPLEDLFILTGASAPYTLNTYVLPIPTITPILGTTLDALICNDSFSDGLSNCCSPPCVP